MKTLAAALLSLSLVGGVAITTAAPSDAQGYYTVKKKKKKYRYKSYRTYAYGPFYYERYANRLPFGSNTWWHQMDREQRGGRR